MLKRLLISLIMTKIELFSSCNALLGDVMTSLAEFLN